MRIRAARGDDFDSVTGLLELLGRPPVRSRRRDDTFAVFEKQVVDPNSHHMVCEDDTGTVTGFCALHFRARLNRLTEEAWIPDLIVAEAARRHGIGEALLAEAERRARDRGCHALVLESGYRRAEAHHLYRQIGMRDEGKFFRKDFDPSD
ncbi:MAG: hypothetical protein NVSMB25_15930 [Thermoleophilaceae bacterium]